jgi:putative effector of murein hydrolase
MAVTTTALAVLAGGLLGPAILAAVAVVVPALVGRILGRLLRTALLLTLPSKCRVKFSVVAV